MKSLIVKAFVLVVALVPVGCASVDGGREAAFAPPFPPARPGGDPQPNDPPAEPTPEPKPEPKPAPK